MLAWIGCPACGLNYTVTIQPIYLQRQGSSVDQHYCMSCETFFHKSDYQENDGQLKDDADFLSDHSDGTYQNLIDFLQGQGNLVNVYEAGTGAGSLIEQLAAAGFVARGIDPNPYAVELARAKGVDVEIGYFSILPEPVDAILALDVLEHVAEPRAFVADVEKSLRSGGLFILRVPEVPRSEWRWLRGADLDRGFRDTDPFRDNSVHITHFSPMGITKMCELVGLQPVGSIVGGYRAFAKSV